MSIVVRDYTAADVPAMIAVWNEAVEEGVAFPQEECLTPESGARFFSEQTHCGVAADGAGRVVGLYILHPNNVGRCGHIANASYAVASASRGRHVGEALVRNCLAAARQHGFSILQFNAVVETNVAARRLYERLGFSQLGTIKNGFRMDGGRYEDICPYYKTL